MTVAKLPFRLRAGFASALCTAVVGDSCHWPVAGSKEGDTCPAEG